MRYLMFAFGFAAVVALMTFVSCGGVDCDEACKMWDTCANQDWQNPGRTCQMDYDECMPRCEENGWSSAYVNCIKRQDHNGQRYCCDIIDNCEG